MLKLGMKPVTGVSRVTVKKSKNVSAMVWCVPTYFLKWHILLICWLTKSAAMSSDLVRVLQTRCFQESSIRHLCHVWGGQDRGSELPAAEPGSRKVQGSWYQQHPPRTQALSCSSGGPGRRRDRWDRHGAQRHWASDDTGRSSQVKSCDSTQSY